MLSLLCSITSLLSGFSCGDLPTRSCHLAPRAGFSACSVGDMVDFWGFFSCSRVWPELEMSKAAWPEHPALAVPLHSSGLPKVTNLDPLTMTFGCMARHDPTMRMRPTPIAQLAYVKTYMDLAPTL